jgi:hypothetical protein
MPGVVERFHEFLVQQQPIPVLGALPSQPCYFVHREPNVKFQERRPESMLAQQTFDK